MSQDKETIGRYQLVTRLAVGGMAEIFLAFERGLAGLERRVVIKRILPHLADQQSFLDMFLREARIIARMNHPNVVQIHELGHDSGQYYIAMEYLEGLTSRELILLSRAAGVQIPINVCVELICQACRGLHVMHELRDLEGNLMGLVHRDVSPQNLMITVDGHVKLVDFGIAKATEGLDATYTGSLKGKFSYMSPEQCLNEPMDRRTDIFTLGIVFWELATQRRLFKRKSEMEMLKAVNEDEIPLPTELRPDFPNVLEPVVLRALERGRDDRYQTAEDMRLAAVEAAEIAKLDIGPDCVSRFIDSVGGSELHARLGELNAATERTMQSISRDYTASPKRAILPQPTVNDSEDLPTITESPNAGKRGGQVLPLHRPVVADTEPRSSRRWWGVGLALVTVAALLFVFVPEGSDSRANLDTPPNGDGAEDAGAGVALEGPPIVIGWPPFIDAELMLADMEPFRLYLEEALGRPIEFSVAANYAECSEKLVEGALDFASLSPLLYVRTKQEHPDISLLAVKQYDGTVSYEGWLMVRSDSPFVSFPDLGGRRFCFTDEDSTSGYFLPRTYIRSHGADPDTFIGSIHWSGQHSQAIRDILDGRCDVVATYNGAIFSAADQGEAIGRLRFVAVTGTIPQDVIVGGPYTSATDLEILTDALFAFDPLRDIGQPRVGMVQRITGFSEISDDAFDLLRTAIELEDAEKAEEPN